MSAPQGSVSPTRTAPARPPDGFWTAHPRYRNYVLFSGTSIVLVLDALIFLRAVQALGEGPAAWASFQATMGSLPAVVLSGLLLIGTVFFSIRFLRVGVNVFTVRIGVLPAPPAPVVFVGQFAGLVGLTALLLLLLGGVIL